MDILASFQKVLTIDPTKLLVHKVISVFCFLMKNFSIVYQPYPNLQFQAGRLLFSLDLLAEVFISIWHGCFYLF